MDVPGESELRGFLLARIGEQADPDRPLEEHGLSSREAAALAGELAELLGRDVSPTIVWEHPTINRLARALTTPDSPERPARTLPGADSPDRPVRAFTASDRPARTLPAPGEPVAVVGIGCRFPGAHGASAYWKMLIDGVDAVGEVPAGRWEAFYGDTVPAGTTRHGGFLDDVAGFDAEFFGIAPGEAAAMDPQHRLLLETAWEALEHGGIAPRSLAGTRTGVFAGVSGTEYAHLTGRNLATVDAWTATGAAPSIAANRLSYLLDLRGPSMAVDTACSSSLVATHLAVSSLRTGECDLALAAGVNLLLSPLVTVAFDRGGGTAADGRCKAFDASADGMVRAEGCGVVVLKRLPDALRDGDRVLAVISATAVNQDGRSNGLVAPNPEAQESLLRQVYDGLGRGPDYIEAHGTGTYLGDPIEARAIAAAVPTPVLLGSAKTNLGHLEAAAGVAGLIKTVLALHHGVIPPSLHFRRPNPHIPWDTLQVVTAPTPWPRGAARRAGVSAFGFGGTNAHVALDAPPAPDLRPASDVRSILGSRPGLVSVSGGGRAKQVIVLTDITPERVRRYARSLTGLAPSADLAHTLARRAPRGRVAAAVVAGDIAELAERLRTIEPVPVTAADGPVWVFGGYRPQPPSLALYDTEPAFKQAIDALAPLLKAEAGIDVHDPAPTGVATIQPIIFAVQYALAASWRAYGFEPAAVIGHSMGEVAAAVVAGGISLPDAVKVICVRARLLGGLCGGGAMAVVAAGAEEVPDDLHVAVYTAPGQTVVTGPPERVAAFAAELAGKGVFARTLTAEGAGHSPQVRPLLPVIREELAGIVAGKPAIPYYSPVFDDPRETPTFEAAYWAAGVRRPVRFMQAVQAAVEDGRTLFTELSPRALLAGALPGPVVEGDFHTQVATVATAVVPRTTGRVVDVPHSPWQHVRHWAASHGLPPVSLSAALDDRLVVRTWTPAPPREAGPRRAWLILADEGDARAARLLSLLPGSSLASAAALLPERSLVSGGARPGATVVLLPPRRLDPAGARQVLLRVADLVRQGCRVTIATERAQAVREGEAPDPGPAALRGLVRVLALEHPEAHATLVDVDDLRDLAAELSGDQPDDEVAWRGGSRYAARLRRTTLPQAAPASAGGPGAYIVTGGYGRLGRIVTRWLAGHDATRVILNGRSPRPADGVAQVVAGDLAAPGTAERLVAAATAGGVRLRGVIHAAGVLDDRLIAGLDAESLERVWAAKVTGGLRLHEATKEVDLDWWVAFSSAAGLLGSPGQAAYAAANAWLDALCEQRRAEGLPGVSIGWGPWDGAATLPAVEPLTEAEGVEALEALIRRNLSAGVIKLDPAQAVTIYPAIARIPYFSEIAGPAGAADLAGTARNVEAAPGTVRDLGDLTPAAVNRKIRERAAAVLGIEPDRLDDGSVLTDLGLDSLAATRLRGTIEHDFGIMVPTAPLLRGGTLGALTHTVAGSLGLSDLQPIEPRDAAERQVVRVLGGLLGRAPSVAEPIAPGVLATAFGLLAHEVGGPLPAPGPVVTVADLADAIRRVDEAEAQHGIVRPLNAGRTGPPLFLAHPAGGTTGVYALLAARLPVPVLGLERLDDAPGIPERAARYAQAIRETGAGPYRLGGWSFGGILAFEIARRLGGDVELVAMIDSGLPEEVDEAERREIHARRYVDFSRYVGETYGTDLHLGLAELLALGEQDQLDLTKARMAESGVLTRLSPAVLRHQITSHEDTMAIEGYRPGTPYQGRVVLYRSTAPAPWAVEDPRYAHDDDPARGFGPYAEHLEIVEIPGSHHLNLLDPPHVEVIAEHLEGLL
ncbi:beta-ketoacyl synthase N-terminal-like domain-containing protein [Nonomuraea sp. NPDC002799]